ncbi:MAG: diphthine synthase [Crenarchaeota archaeon 13_1_20CM_2_51_8]|nr:MAG: diphthine synthase [Crenarchaeota archaeon 13_1_20CM_2_51_8]
MPKVTFIGLGLDSEQGITLEGLDTARNASRVFAEFYTNLMPNLNLENLERLVGRKVTVLGRRDIEDSEGKAVHAAASEGDVTLLVPGDPMVATTHVALRLSLAKRGFETRIIHSASIISAVCGATGLQNYKFGRSVTLPAEPAVPKSVIQTLVENRQRDSHTLLFLDVRVEERTQIAIPEALQRLKKVLPESSDWLVVGLARVGASDQLVKAGSLNRLSKQSFGGPPQVMVFPSKLHFMEAKALKAFCGAEDTDLEGTA